METDQSDDHNSIESDEDSSYMIFPTQSSKPGTVDPVVVELSANSVTISMNLDTGALLFIISEITYDKINAVVHVPTLLLESTVEP